MSRFNRQVRKCWLFTLAFCVLGFVAVEARGEAPQPVKPDRFLSFKACGGDITVSLEKHGDIALPGLEKSFDTNKWEKIEDASDPIPVKEGKTLYLRTDQGRVEPNVFATTLDYRTVNAFWSFKLESEGDAAVEGGGDVMAVFDRTAMSNFKGKNCVFANLFSGCSRLTVAPKITVSGMVPPLTFWGMFQDCTALKAAPRIDAPSLSKLCCAEMFAGCTSLVSGPEILPATTLGSECYRGMFSNCVSLTSAPVLAEARIDDDSMKLHGRIYESMFEGCSALKISPRILAKDMYGGCVKRMFTGCSSLRRIETNLSNPKSVVSSADGLREHGVLIGSEIQDFLPVDDGSNRPVEERLGWVGVTNSSLWYVVIPKCDQINASVEVDDIPAEIEDRDNCQLIGVRKGAHVKVKFTQEDFSIDEYDFPSLDSDVFFGDDYPMPEPVEFVNVRLPAQEGVKKVFVRRTSCAEFIEIARDEGAVLMANYEYELKVEMEDGFIYVGPPTYVVPNDYYALENGVEFWVEYVEMTKFGQEAFAYMRHNYELNNEEFVIDGRGPVYPISLLEQNSNGLLDACDFVEYLKVGPEVEMSRAFLRRFNKVRYLNGHFVSGYEDMVKFLGLNKGIVLIVR